MSFLITVNRFLCVSPPDYLNNLSPDSKEYEDTQGGQPRTITTTSLPS